MDVVAVSSDSECESEVIRPTSAVVFTPTSLNMDVEVVSSDSECESEVIGLLRP